AMLPIPVESPDSRVKRRAKDTLLCINGSINILISCEILNKPVDLTLEWLCVNIVLGNQLCPVVPTCRHREAQ
ncbi:MAG: hypothetical protein HW384_1225, partial [Dehalococcoidia bacterium]|nr:hypothetical protein [Dehalococcoidia bacterium]